MARNYIRKINEKYITDFHNRVISGLSSVLRVSSGSYLKVVVKEVNRLFRIISGRMTSKRQIPKPNSFPDVNSYNEFLENIGIDLDKIYAAQDYVEQDLQNVLNFNSLERERAVHSLADTQSLVYSAYIKSGKSVTGDTVIKETFRTDTLPVGSNGVSINLEREALTLQVVNEIIDRNTVDKELVNVYFSESPDEKYRLFPNNTTLSMGSHWQKKAPAEIHFTNKENLASYREGMVDGPVAQNAGSVQFEAVATFDYTADGSDPIRKRVEDRLSKVFNKHRSTIMVDKVNSLQGRYISSNEDININPKVKLVIPFRNASPSSSLLVDLQPNDNNDIPTIDFSESFIYDRQGRRRRFVEFGKNKLEEYSKTGRFTLYFLDGVFVPVRAELTLFYTQNAWTDISYYMVLYNYSAYKTLTLEAFDDAGDINAIFTKVAHVFVDAESNISNERKRATNTMLSSEVDK